MADLFKPLLNIAGDWLTTLTRRRLQQKRRAARMQARTLPTLLGPISHTKRGQLLGISATMPETAFRQNVPLSDFRDLAPWIEQVKAGQADVLWPGTCACFVATAGTTTGSPRLIPVTAHMQTAYAAGARDAIMHATARGGGMYALLGRILLLGGSVASNRLNEEDDIAVADLATLAAVQHPEWVAHHYFEPGSRIALRQNWDTMVERILKRVQRRNITLFAGHPQWVLAFSTQVLRALARGKVRPTALTAIWRHLRCVVITGDFPAPVRHQLKQIAGPRVMLHEVFTTAESFIAAQGPGSIPGLRLLAETGVYFEFLPLDDYDAERLAELGPMAVSLAQVTVDRNYLLVLTTPAGLVRHITGDVVKFTSVQPPRLLPMGQVDLRLDTFGENLLTREIIEVLTSVCRAHKWTLAFFHVAPLHQRTELGVNHGCHEWWIELRSGTIDTPTGPLIAAELDQRLRDSHEAYRDRRKQGNLASPYVRLVMPGAFEHWMRHHDKWGGPHKLPITRNDRKIADSLASMARFSKD